MVSHKKENNYDKIYSNIENEDDIENIIKKIKKYDIKRKEYENNVYNYYKEKKRKRKNSIGLGSSNKYCAIVF